MKIFYKTRATSIGGRSGRTALDDGSLALDLAVPGSGKAGANPEQLFAIGYSACFLGAMKGAARKQGKKLPEDAVVTADVSFADREDGVGFTIVPELTATVPGWSKADVEALMQVAHDICPYSNLIRFAHEVELKAG